MIFASAGAMMTGWNVNWRKGFVDSREADDYKGRRVGACGDQFSHSERGVEVPRFSRLPKMLSAPIYSPSGVLVNKSIY